MLFPSKKAVDVSDEQAMQQIMLLLEDWKAPEPTPWFDARMMARFREEQKRAPEGFFARLRNQWNFSQRLSIKPLMAGAMALVVMAGGGSYWQLTHLRGLQPTAMSATVQDLQVLDTNDQTLQQMGQLLDDNDDGKPQS